MIHLEINEAKNDCNAVLFQGDAIKVLEENAHQWNERFRFVFIDPPFNIGQEYDYYVDRIDDDSFQDWLIKLVGGCSQLLVPGGVLALHVPDTLAHVSLSIARTLGLSRIDWLIWHYRFAQNISPDVATKFLSSKCHCLIFRNGSEPHVFNASDILVPSDRLAKYEDSRIDDSPYSGYRLPLDVLSIENNGAFWGRVPGNSKERQDLGNHPNQLPERYLELLIRAYTNAGDFIFDPCAGTGTTLAVGNALKRNVYCSEISQAYCVDIVERFKKGPVRL